MEKCLRFFCSTIKFKKIKNGQFSFFYILQLPHSVISNSEKSTHPIVRVPTWLKSWGGGEDMSDSDFERLNEL